MPRSAGHERRADHDEERESRGAVPIGAVRPDVQAGDEQCRERQRRKQKADEAAEIVCASEPGAAVMRVGTDQGPSRNIDVGRPGTRGFNANSQLRPAGQRALPRGPRVGEVARRPLRRRR